jgi:hypothetical protein
LRGYYGLWSTGGVSRKYRAIKKDGLDFVSLYLKIRIRRPICSNWWFQRQMFFLVGGWMLKRRRNARCTAVGDSVLINSRNIDVRNWVHLFETPCIREFLASKLRNKVFGVTVLCGNIYRVVQEEKSIFWGVTVSVNVREKKGSYTKISNFEWLPR